ncbi:probable LRR receptor-like serine/threonine-protein kinase At3g47570 isoform X2 [Magnolia sinica]|uniref:probable LRR receptor-like serine/threonine-protein kinase At3g47570 isoform X2 n=1 Tax=Magnolia sinica TaxID=86752 RepID=UPI00265A6BE1|nr:probable LRR receptor-like serine/threonine-protein kinase At3g47570 isoform X2 [Magnolia sinica]
MTQTRPVSSFLFHCILVVCVNLLCSDAASAVRLGNETDRLALIAFKDQIAQQSPVTTFSSWNDSIHFCQWEGITCSRRHHQRVVALNLVDRRLMGSISPRIGNLSFLQRIDLSSNSFHGKLPKEIGGLPRLQYLNLSHNSLGGQIPSNLTYSSELKAISLAYNNLIGEIPVNIGSLLKLVHLYLNVNNLNGTVPPSLGNLSSLENLFISENSLQGSIPHDLGRMGSIKNLALGENEFSGMVPPSLYNLSSLIGFGMNSIGLQGTLPPHVGLNFPNIRRLLFGGNQFTGPIPVSLPNASKLEYLDFTDNRFSGSVPGNLGSLEHLRWLGLGANQLGSREASDDLSVLTSLTNCTNLEVLLLGENHLSGVLPNSMANLSTHLRELWLGTNQIFGTIPIGIENLINLTVLTMEENFFTGNIPTGIGKLEKLEEAYFYSNRLSGQIPSSFGNITRLYKLSMYGNGLQGIIPPSLGDCKRLQQIDLSHNNLSGTIPKKIFGIPSLSLFDFSKNILTGPLPSEVSNLKNLETLNVAENTFSGEIPSSLSSCTKLEYLYLDGNFFQGTIPSSLSTLKGLRRLDLSSNNLHGKIPEYLEGFQFLQYLNLSYNDFEGVVPKQGIFKNASAISILGNNKLCGGIPLLRLEACPSQASKKQGMSRSLKVIISISSLVLFLIGISASTVAFIWIKKSRKPSSISSLENQNMNISYGALVKATDGFSPANLIGVGSYGSVYQGILDQIGTTVAVKVLNLQRQGASKSFMAECGALRNIRHRNLIKVITACSSIDFHGNDFKALILEYMPNGSLEKWLHPVADEPHQLRNLSLFHRLNVAIDVASALDYLHHDCQTPIAHRDLKPSNILLNDDMTAHVADFGLAKLLSEGTDNSSQNQTTSIVIKGTIGYVAPESMNFRIRYGRQCIDAWRCVQLWDPSIGDVHRKTSY